MVPAGYFDYAAATPMDADVRIAMDGCQDNFYNPSAQYGPARTAKELLETARRDIAGLLGVKPLEVVFTAGATEANNLAIHGVMQRFPEGNIVFSAIEHESVRAPSKQYGYKILPVDKNGVIQLDEIANTVDDQTVLVSVMLANNEIGTIQPLTRLARLLGEIRTSRAQKGNKLPLYLHTDAAQAGNYLDIHAHRLGVDMLTINSGKLYGPKQMGLLFVASGVDLKPLTLGGGQERGLRSGTENIAGAVGLAAALKKAQALRPEEQQRVCMLQSLFLEQLEKHIPQAVVNGSRKSRLANNVHITVPGQDNERLLMLLDDQGYYAAAGSACSASHDAPSEVLAAIGLGEAEARASLRFTMGRGTTDDDVRGLVETLSSLLAR